MKLIFSVVLVVGLSGCESLISNERIAVDAARRAVDYYCSKSQIGRSIVRNAVADAIAPNRFEILCANDSPEN